MEEGGGDDGDAGVADDVRGSGDVEDGGGEGWAVAEVAEEDAESVEGGGEVDAAVPDFGVVGDLGGEVDGGAEAGEAAEGGGDADGAAGVGADGGEGGAFLDAGDCSAGGASGEAGAVDGLE